MRRIVIAAIKFAFIEGKREANFISSDNLDILGAAVYTDSLVPTLALYLKDVASELFGYFISDITSGFRFISWAEPRIVGLLRKIRKRSLKLAYSI